MVRFLLWKLIEYIVSKTVSIDQLIRIIRFFRSIDMVTFDEPVPDIFGPEIKELFFTILEMDESRRRSWLERILREENA